MFVPLFSGKKKRWQALLTYDWLQVPCLVLLRSRVQLVDLHVECGWHGDNEKQTPPGTGT